jgi:hypothetical protein
LEVFPICDCFLGDIELFQYRLGFLVVGPEIGALRLLLEIGSLASKPIYLKDTPEVYLDAI